MSADLKEILDEYGLEYFNRYYACYKGTVHNNEDPENLGRLQLKVPEVYGENPFEYWAGSKGIYSGKGVGSFWIPAIGDQVWVTFESGDPAFPIWEYGAWRKGEVPEGASIDNKVLQTNSGHKIELDDKNGLVRITDKHGHIVELNEKGVSIVSDSISFGSLDESAEPAVLGDTAVALLNEFIEDVGNISAIVTSTGITSTINTSPQWAGLVSKWQQKWKTFRSKVVSLD